MFNPPSYNPTRDSFLVPEFTSPDEIKKKIAKKVNYFLLIITISFSVMLAFFWTSIIPKITKIYEDFDVALPVSTLFLLRYFPYIAGGVILLFVLIFIFVQKNVSYKTERADRGYVKITPENNFLWLEPMILIFLGVLVGFLVVTIINPISSLTSTF